MKKILIRLSILAVIAGAGSFSTAPAFAWPQNETPSTQPQTGESSSTGSLQGQPNRVFPLSPDVFETDSADVGEVAPLRAKKPGGALGAGVKKPMPVGIDPLSMPIEKFESPQPKAPGLRLPQGNGLKLEVTPEPIRPGGAAAASVTIVDKTETKDTRDVRPGDEELADWDIKDPDHDNVWIRMSSLLERWRKRAREDREQAKSQRAGGAQGPATSAWRKEELEKLAEAYDSMADYAEKKAKEVEAQMRKEAERRGSGGWSQTPPPPSPPSQAK